MAVGFVQRMRDRAECRRVRPLLQAFIDGRLDDADRERVVRHLDACRRCGLEVATYRTLIARLHDVDPPPPRDAVDRLEAFVDDLVDRGPSPPADPGAPPG